MAWDPDFEEKKKQGAKQATKLPTLTGNHAVPPQVIPIECVMDRDDSWVVSFRMDANLRAKYGVETEKGKWAIKDKAKFEKVDLVKREKLRPWWNKPL